jgi:DNA-binding transcriptional regulator YiaG
MRGFDAACLTVPPMIKPAQIKHLRKQVDADLCLPPPS